MFPVGERADTLRQRVRRQTVELGQAALDIRERKREQDRRNGPGGARRPRAWHRSRQKPLAAAGGRPERRRGRRQRDDRHVDAALVHLGDASFERDEERRDAARWRDRPSSRAPKTVARSATRARRRGGRGASNDCGYRCKLSRPRSSCSRSFVCAEGVVARREIREAGLRQWELAAAQPGRGEDCIGDGRGTGPCAISPAPSGGRSGRLTTTTLTSGASSNRSTG